MKFFSKQSFKDFVIETGYKHEVIDDWGYLHIEGSKVTYFGEKSKINY